MMRGVDLTLIDSIRKCDICDTPLIQNDLEIVTIHSHLPWVKTFQIHAICHNMANSPSKYDKDRWRKYFIPQPNEVEMK